MAGPVNNQYANAGKAAVQEEEGEEALMSSNLLMFVDSIGISHRLQ
jgi:hypothetical protein